MARMQERSRGHRLLLMAVLTRRWLTGIRGARTPSPGWALLSDKGVFDQYSYLLLRPDLVTWGA